MIFKTKIYSRVLTIFILAGFILSCESEGLETTDQSLGDENLFSETVTENATTREVSSEGGNPWDFDSDIDSNDDFQVDNDGNGSHNWDEDDYNDDDDHNRNDINVRNFIYLDSNNDVVLQCPNGTSGSRGRRAEYRGQGEVDLNDAHRMDLTLKVRDYVQSRELIISQLHNDDDRVSRPYLTIVAENGVISMKRANHPSDDGTTTSGFTVPFREGDRYRIRMDSRNNSREVFVRIINLNTGDRAQTTFNWRTAWNSVDDSFYWKFGAYMPDGGSTDTCTIVERVSFIGQ